MKLLVIEPDLVLAKIYQNYLNKRNVKVSTIHHAQDALKDIDRSKPDCIVLELQLGGHSGVEFLHEFRSYEDWIGIPIYIYTNISQNHIGINKKTLDSFGVKGYFDKSTTSIKQLADIILSDLAG